MIITKLMRKQDRYMNDVDVTLRQTFPRDVEFVTAQRNAKFTVPIR